MNTRQRRIFTILVTTFLVNVVSHSWLECTNYNIGTVGKYFKDKCMGFPRAFERQYNVNFGVDTGFNVVAKTKDAMCPSPYNKNDYNDKIPMATYRPGQLINLAWPAKNHVADFCTNQFIPDNGVNVYRSVKPFTDDFTIKLEMINPKHKNGVVDKQGYQRCLNFCDDMDKSPCYNTFILDTQVTESGIYSFKWVWEFNPGEFYISCFDAYISVGGTDIKPVPVPVTPTPEVTPEVVLRDDYISERTVKQTLSILEKIFDLLNELKKIIV